MKKKVVNNYSNSHIKIKFNLNDVKKCLNFLHFNNPIFILSTVGYSFLNSKKIGLIILISHYLAAILIGLFNKRSELNNTNQIKYKSNNYE